MSSIINLPNWPQADVTSKLLLLPDFPRGKRIIRFGERVETVHGVFYTDSAGNQAEMVRAAYVVYVDRLILACDVWPRTIATDSEVSIIYTPERT